MLKINFIDAPDLVITLELELTRYYLRLLWNDEGDYWTLSIRNAENQFLVEGIKIVPRYPLLSNYHQPEMPPGEFIVICQNDVLKRDDFKVGKATLVYMARNEFYGTV